MNRYLLTGALAGLLVAGWCVRHAGAADDDAAPTENKSLGDDSSANNSKYVKVTSPLHAYEYAVLRITELPEHQVEAHFEANKVSLDEIGHGGPESGRRKLLRDIGGKGVAPDALPLLNELGSQGWELMSQDGDDHNGTYTFKRQLK